MKKSFISIIQRTWRRHYYRKKYGSIEEYITLFQNYYRKFVKKGKKHRLKGIKLNTISLMIGKAASKDFDDFLGSNRVQTVAQILKLQVRFRRKYRFQKEKKKLKSVLLLQRIIRGFLARKEVGRIKRDYLTVKRFVMRKHFNCPSEVYKISQMLIREDIFEAAYHQIRELRKIKKTQALYRGYVQPRLE